MNRGGHLDEAIHSVRAPAHLEERPYLRPVYDEPEFIVRNIWRLYGGWWDGNPATLKPAPERALAAELAGHLAWLAAPGDSAIAEIHRRVFAARADTATSTMARGVFRWAAE
jgi:alkyl sulfatase BDS1-like metallo-beta-lactamase superfamily hydrolase